MEPDTCMTWALTSVFCCGQIKAVNTLWCAFLEASITLGGCSWGQVCPEPAGTAETPSHPPGYCCAKLEALTDSRVTSAPLSEALSLVSPASTSHCYHRRGSEGNSPCFSLAGL